MILDWLSSLSSLGLYENASITFDGGFSVYASDIVCFAFFALALLNIWLALKFFLKKVI